MIFLPQNADPETRAWSVNSFRLLEDTLQARKLREGLINRPACIEINRKAGSVELVLSLRQLYLLLQAFHDSGVAVEAPDHQKALDRFIRAGEEPLNKSS